jgi:hypothetical protein
VTEDSLSVREIDALFPEALRRLIPYLRLSLGNSDFPNNVRSWIDFERFYDSPCDETIAFRMTDSGELMFLDPKDEPQVLSYYIWNGKKWRHESKPSNLEIY